MYSEWRQSYISEFLSLRCAGDVLNVVSPLGAKAKKEVTESMAVIRHLRKIALQEPGKFILYDLCAGNALTSVIAAHLLPFRKVIAVDKRPRNRQWWRVRGFEYVIADIHSWQPDESHPGVVISIHPCRDLALRVCTIFNSTPSCRYLVLMPCCVGGIPTHYLNRVIMASQERVSKYEVWGEYLANMVNGEANRDEKCLSPRNIIITSSKDHPAVHRDS